MIEPTLSGHEELIAAVVTLLGESKLSVKALVPQLDARLWEDNGVAEALRHFLVGHSRAQATICVQDISATRPGTARLLDLVERVPSRCELRLAAREHADLTESFLLFDDRHYLRQAASGERLWKSHAHPPNEAARLTSLFDEVWQYAQPHPDLRRLNL